MDDRTLTTLCYMERDGKYLMLHRTKKKNDMNHDKYIGVGGRLERGESPEDCVRREVWEETGCTLTSFRLRGVLSFVIDDVDEYTFLYTADGFEGEPGECSEGELEWIPRDEVEKLPLWEGDHLFLRLLEERQEVFSMKLVYRRDELTAAELDGKPMKWK